MTIVVVSKGSALGARVAGCLYARLVVSNGGPGGGYPKSGPELNFNGSGAS